MAELSTLIGEQSVESIGVVMNDPDAATVNSDALNEWAESIGTDSERALTSKAGDIYITDNPWTIDGKKIPAILGAGAGCDIYGTDDPFMANSGATRLIGIDLPNVVVFQNGGGCGNFSGWNIYGFMAPTRAEIVAGAADYADALILLKDGSGQMYGDLLQLCAGKVGIQCGENAGDNQTDNLNYQRLVGNHCSQSVIKTISQQSVGHLITEFQQFGCPVGIHSVNSCDFTITNAYVLGDGDTNDTFLKVDYATVNSNAMVVACLKFDGSSHDGIIVNCTAHSFADISIGYLDLPPTYSAVPSAILRGSADLTIKGGRNLIAGMFKGYQITDGATFYPSFIARDAKMNNGVAATALGNTTNSSQGTSYITIDGLKPYSGTGGPCAWTKQTWLDGALQ